MAQFHPLEVTDVRKTIRNAVVVTLKPANGADFDFIPGQYLTFRRDFDGTELRRSYSICAGKDDGVLQVGIKRVDGGAFSSWANETLEPGMTLDAMPPMGAFHTPLSPNAGKTYLGFAGGSGITPVLSILKTILAREPDSTFTLIYANRGVHTIMFREELEDLKNQFMGRFNVLHILESDAQDIDLFQGRIDEAKCAELFERWVDVRRVDTAFICGPEPMMLGITKSLKDHGLTDDQIKFELFKSAQTGRLTKRKTFKSGSDVKPVQASVVIDGIARSFDMDRDTSVLNAALENALEAPYACTAGVCSTCKCKVLEGEVEMIANHALEDYEVRAGYVLSCQSYPVSDKLTVTYDT